MTAPITRTKVILPRRRSDLLTRNRLVDSIQIQLERKLLIVVAPAGYGKTSLLIDVADQSVRSVCWYSIDRLDRDIYRFLSHFFAAIAQHFPKFGGESAALLQNFVAGQATLEQLIVTTVNELYETVDEHFLLMLDDYHLVDDCDEINEFVSQFVERVDEQCHLVIASRSLLRLPALPLLVARSHVGGLGLEELAFQTDEVQALLSQNHGLSINDSTALKMIDASEGWITGLLLSAQAMQADMAQQSRLIRASGVDLYGYLAQEVFEQQEPAIQEFLLRTSLLEEFDAALCAAVFEPLWYAEGSDWQLFFDELLTGNLFVLPVGDDGSWLRYHHLFQEFLQQKLTVEQPHDHQAILERLADVWFERAEWEKAYQLYQRAGAQHAIIDLVEVAGAALLKSDRIQLLGQWLDAVNDEVVRNRPILGSLKGCIAVLRGDSGTGVALLSRAVEAFSGGNHFFQQAVALNRRAVAHRFAGDYQETINDAKEALHLLGLAEENSLHQGDSEIVEAQADALRAMGVSLRMSGKLRQGLDSFQNALGRYRSIQSENNCAKTVLDIALIHLDSGRYNEAARGFIESCHLWEKSNNPVGQANVLNNLGVVFHVQGRYLEAHEAFIKAMGYAQRSGHTTMVILVQVSMGDLFAELDMQEKATIAYNEASRNPEQINEQFLAFYLTIARAMLACVADDLSSAYEHLDVAGRFVLEKRSNYEWGLYRLAMGRFYLAQQEQQRAIPPLRDAIESFRDGQRQTEEAIARLLTAVAHHKNDELTDAVHQIKTLISITENFESHQPLVAIARRVEPSIRKLYQKIGASNQDDAYDDIHLYVGSLLKQISEFNKQISSIQKSIKAASPTASNKREKIEKAPATSITEVAALQVRTFGRIEVRQDSKPVTSGEWQSQTARDLFLCLLAHPDGLTKEEVGEIFWPDSAPAQLKIRFKNAIYRLRNAVGQQTILFKKGVYQFDRTQDYECDAELFVSQIMQAHNADSIETEQSAYEIAVDLYKGDYLPGIDTMWAWLERERLRTIFLEASTRLAEIHLKRELYSEALERCQKILAIDPCMEETHRLAMSAYASMGNRAGVVRQYEQCCSVLQEEIDAPPSEQTEELFRTLMR